MSATDDPISQSDPCLDTPIFSTERFMLFLPFFLMMFVGVFFSFIYFDNSLVGTLFGAFVSYTSAVILYTFSANRGLPRYLFQCPVVQSLLPQLLKRHIAFVFALIFVLTTALQSRSSLPSNWIAGSGDSKDMPPFIIILFIILGVLALSQILTNRSLLERVHHNGTGSSSEGNFL
jgi:hypothetical protein